MHIFRTFVTVVDGLSVRSLGNGHMEFVFA